MSVFHCMNDMTTTHSSVTEEDAIVNTQVSAICRGKNILLFEIYFPINLRKSMIYKLISRNLLHKRI